MNGSRALHLSAWLLFCLLCSAAVARDDSCETCRKLVDRFHKGLENTAKKNFGGGNTAWEEKTLSKYESSEIRLVEIIENLCDSSDFECNHMVEEHEEQIEKWWFKMKKKYPDLLKWFCIETIKVCCPPGTYGPDCLACLGGSERPCHGNGFCNGDGTRSGDGLCRCEAEYTGPFCLECADEYFSSERNDTYSLCTACNQACKTCDGPSNEDCKECKNGWIKDDGKCVDVDECDASEQVCSRENETCLNTAGSYKCTCSEGFEDKEGNCVKIMEAENTEVTDGEMGTSASDINISNTAHEDL
ncbi:cysteine-rich with EGF-like domain protein 2-A isoform X1 [Xenopus laevis]|uniref:Cysteine-rich with EGF-like domain protein 2-A isoform X1 n=1 Tax=Xenopus laevis TaxID=8355 RepID=A0A8J0UUP2_XENLA|nr:cysteine-rich with EGF-like domain protein 2-A isoform X1 [Xenopus laevis]